MADEGNLLRVARPTINVAGQEEPRLASGLLNLAISENTQGLFRCEATFGNWDGTDNPTGFLYFDRRKLDFGKEFKVKLDDEPLFEGRIMGLEAQFPRRPAAADHRAGRRPLSGFADDAPHAHVLRCQRCGRDQSNRQRSRPEPER